MAFITDWNEIQKIIKHLKLPNFPAVATLWRGRHPPPKITAPTIDLDQDLNQDIYPDDFSFAA